MWFLFSFFYVFLLIACFCTKASQSAETPRQNAFKRKRINEVDGEKLVDHLSTECTYWANGIFNLNVYWLCCIVSFVFFSALDALTAIVVRKFSSVNANVRGWRIVCDSLSATWACLLSSQNQNISSKNYSCSKHSEQ